MGFQFLSGRPTGVPSLAAFGDRFGLRMSAVAVHGTAWTTLGMILTYAVRLSSTLILTRLLMPEVFGLMSLASVFLMALQMLSDIGTVPSIIRSERGEDPEFLRTAWTIQVIRGFGIALLLCALAWPLSVIYDEPLLFPVLSALSLTAVFEGFSSISIAVCRRQLKLFKITMLGFVAQFVTTAVSVVAAWALQSVWALVIGGLVGALVRLAISHAWLPRFAHAFRLEPAALREIGTFGRWILLATLFTYFGGQGTKAVMGGLVELDTLGMITIATTLAWAAGDLVSKVLNNVAFPSLSRIYRDRPQDLAGAVGKVKRMIFFFVLPVFLALSFTGEWLAGVLYEDLYGDVGLFLRLMALNSAIGVLSMPYQNALLTMGKSHLHAAVMFALSVGVIVGMVGGFYLAGIFGMIAGLAFGNLVAYLLSTYFAWREGLTHFFFDALMLGVILPIYAYTWTVVMAG